MIPFKWTTQGCESCFFPRVHMQMAFNLNCMTEGTKLAGDVTKRIFAAEIQTEKRSNWTEKPPRMQPHRLVAPWPQQPPCARQSISAATKARIEYNDEVKCSRRRFEIQGSPRHPTSPTPSEICPHSLTAHRTVQSKATLSLAFGTRPQYLSRDAARTAHTALHSRAGAPFRPRRARARLAATPQRARLVAAPPASASRPARPPALPAALSRGGARGDLGRARAKEREGKSEKEREGRNREREREREGTGAPGQDISGPIRV